MDQSNEAGPSVKQVEGQEIDADWLQLIKTNHEVRLHDRFSLEGLPQECNLSAVSNVWGLIIVGGASDIRIHRLSDFQSQLEVAGKEAAACTPIQTVSLPDRPVWIRLAMNEERLVVATANSTGIHIYRLSDVLRGHTSPYHSFNSDVPSHLIDLLPNPAPSTEPQGRYVAALAKEGMVLADIEEKRLLRPLPGPFTSVKGKQIVLGMPDGRLIRFTPDGEPRGEIPPPPDLEQPGYPSFVQWIDTNVFLVGYAPSNGTPDDSLEIYVINRTPTEISYTKFFDPLDTMGVLGRSSTFRYFAALKQWGSRTKHLAFLMSGLAAEVAVLHESAEGEAPNWEVCILEETARAVMPIGKAGVSEDTACLGLALDLTNDKPIRRGIVGGVEQPDLPPAPRVLVYSQNGVIISFNVQYPDAGQYPGMVQPKDILTAVGNEEAMSTAVPTPVAEQPAAIAIATEKSADAFGGFGSGGAFGQSAFGSSSTPSAFGSSATPSAFGSSAAPAFGSAFGAPSKCAAGAGGFAGFGQSAVSTTPASTPAKPPPAFGSSGGFSTPTPNPFGQTQTGANSYTEPKPAQVSAFGQSGFGQASGSSAFGAPSFGQKPASGQSSTPSAFGQSSFGQPSTTPTAFGNTTSPAAGGFGAFGNAKPAASQTGFGFGKSAFGSNYQDPTVSRSGFGGGGSAFGSGSGFGQSAFGGGSGSSAFGQSGISSVASSPVSETGGFAGFGQQNKQGAGGSAFSGFGQPKAISPAPQPTSDDFGLGGFASALEGSTATSKAGVPGLADSPPTSPTFLSHRPSGLDEDDSPPTSPIFAAKKPPAQPASASSASSFIKPPTAFGGSGTTSAFGGQSSQSGTSGFIKPATAFGGGTGASASGFGAFGQTSAKAATGFGSGNTSTPNAFSSSPSTSTNTAASGAPAFGQSSTPTKPAFGTTGTAFGQSSKPTAFGQSSLPSSGGFGNISGGFGGFAAKSATTTTPTSSPGPGSTGTGGFGGFAASASKGSGGFGGAGSGGGFAALLSGDKPKVSSGDIFGSKEADQAKSESRPEPPKQMEEAKVEKLSPASPSEAANESVSTEKSANQRTNEAKPEKAILPPGYDTSSSFPPPTTEPAVLPAGYDVPTTKIEAAVLPAGYDVPSTSSSAKVGGQPIDNTPSGSVTASADAHSTPDVKEEEAKAIAVPLPDAGGGADAESDASEGEQAESAVLVGSASVVELPDSDQETREEDDYDEYDEEEEDEEDEEGYDEEEDVDEEYEGEEEEGEYDGQADSQELDDPDGGEEGDRDGEASPSPSPTSDTPSLPNETDVTGNAGDPKPAEEQVDSTTTAEPTSRRSDAGPTLLSRLSPAPQSDQTSSQQPKFSFTNKHAARTASPLGSQPPHTPEESSTPPGSPFKPVTAGPAASAAAGGFSLFGAKQEPTTTSAPSLFGSKAETKQEVKPETKTPSFGFGLGKPPASIAQEPKTPSNTTPTGQGQSLFGAPTSGQSLFGTSQPAQAQAPVASASASTEQQKSPFSFGLGLGKPPATHVPTTTKSAFDFSLPKASTSESKSTPPSIPAPGGNVKNLASVFESPPKNEKPSGFSLFDTSKTSTMPIAAKIAPVFGSPHSSSPSQSIFGNAPTAAAIKQPDAPVAPPAAPVAPPKTPPPPPPPATSFTLPVRQAVPTTPPRQSDGNNTMAGVMERMIQDLQEDLRQLQLQLSSAEKFHAALRDTNFVKVQLADLDRHKILPFSSIEDTSDIADSLLRDLRQYKSSNTGVESKIAELQSAMLKTDVKSGQLEQFAKAKDDPSSLKAIEVTQLSAQQAADQAKLTEAVLEVEAGLDDLEMSLATMKRRLETGKDGDATASSPVERMQRSIRSLDETIKIRQQSLADLSKRFSTIDLTSAAATSPSSPSATTSSPQQRPTRQYISLATPSSAGQSPTKRNTLPVSAEIQEDVKEALADDFGTDLLKRLQGRQQTKLSEPSSKMSSVFSSIRSPVRMDDIPAPGQASVSELKAAAEQDERVKQEGDTSPSSEIKKEAASPSASSTPGSSPFSGIKFFLDPGQITSQPRSGGGGSSGRASSSNRQHTPAARLEYNASASMPGGFDFALPSPTGSKGGKGDAAPSGFFSFSGYGQK